MVKLIRNNFRWLALFLPILFLVMLNITSNTGIDIFISVLFLFGLGLGLFMLEKNQLESKWTNFLKFSLFIVSIIFCLLSFYYPSVWISLIFIIVWFVFNLWIRKDVVSIFNNRMINGILWLAWLGFVPLIPILINEIQTRFSEEEFFVAIQYIKLLILFAVLLFTLYSITRGFKNIFLYEQSGRAVKWLVLMVFIVFGTVLFWGFKSYQNSFYPKQGIQVIPGITEENPFICEEAEEEYPIEEKDVFSKAVKLLIENPNKSSPEYGLLSLVTDDQEWQILFRDTLLMEAEEGKYTEPANSVKYGQYVAALRAYYYGNFIKKYPNVFTEPEIKLIHSWFAEINRRAMTVEWVDWLYGTAFSMWPEGPYENQEIGGGLISMLLTYELSAPELIEKNISYIERNQRGWDQRFRNTDDSFVYQTEWVTNAYLESQYLGLNNIHNMNNSFEWMKLQTLPDGSAAHYNFPHRSSIAGPMLLGYYLTSNPEYLWLADRALDNMEDEGLYLSAIPGIDKFITNNQFIKKPNELSCILYGNSGLPNQHGPLAPDKIVMRTGWENDSSYLLINLRFTGWHRYKSTNTITTLYQGGLVLEDDYSNSAINWLPEGRSKFRDKRIPRENLSGFLVERDGLDGVLCKIIGCESVWAQNPPFYGRIDEYQFDDNKDFFSISFEWNEVMLTQEFNFFDDGVILIKDTGITNGENKRTIALTYKMNRTDTFSYNLIDGVFNESLEILNEKNKLSLLTIVFPEKLNVQSISIDGNSVVPVDQNDKDKRYSY